MNIANSEPGDLSEIIRLYEVARSFQKTKGAVPWPEFDCKLIETEILQHQQWKILIDYQIACVWCTSFADPQIWEERNTDPSIYIHRIASDPTFRGRNLVAEIVKWARVYANENGKKFIRMDTVGENTELIKYYQKCGFEFLGLSKLKDTSTLPVHYHNATVSLFQISLQ
jgi:ribosomal protein S18 acetylase RimI-like enzyme